MLIGAYNVLDEIHIGSSSKLFLASKGNRDKKYVLKTTLHAGSGNKSEFAVVNEMEMYKALDFDSGGYEIFKYDENFVLAREYYEGTTLAEWLDQKKISLKEGLELGIKIAEGLKSIHKKKVIHKDLNPSNIIFNKVKGNIRIIDFDLATQIDFKSHYMGNPQNLEGTLPYMSPEQTGRMNRSVDFRSDLYALGIVLFEIFTGKLPFGNQDPLEIIHGHLSKNCPRPSIYNPEIPLVLEKVIGKLLEKNPDERYQTAHAVLLDLKSCLQMLDNDYQEDFEIARYNAPIQFQIPEKLYGREKERKSLMEAFGLCTKGRKILYTLGGYAGIGKTSLVYDVHIPVTLQRGFFIDGKFEQFKQNSPYFAWIQAIKKFVEIILTEDEEKLNYWKEKILLSLGESAGVITQMVPLVEKIIGPQELSKDLSVAEDLNRFNFAIRQFIKAISTKQHPLVIFLDDVQWADSASLNMLRVIMTEPGLGYLMVITAYRDNEISEDHQFVIGLKELEREWKKINETDISEAYAPDDKLIFEVSLDNLQLFDIHNLLKDTFKDSREDTSRLADLLFTKTNGNPFFIHNFLETLYQEDLIFLQQLEEGVSWSFDFEKISQLVVSESVGELMARQLEKLPKETIELTKKASIIGFEFELGILADLLEMEITDVEKTLWPAIQSGYLIPKDPNYRYIPGFGYIKGRKLGFKFAHDRIRKAFYEKIPESTKKEFHKKSGLILYSKINKTHPSERIFEVAEHLNLVADEMADKKLLRDVNFLAGDKAKNSAAYEAGYGYFEKAIQHAGPDAWQEDYERHLLLLMEIAECTYLTDYYSKTEAYVAEILQNSRSPLDAVKANSILISAYFVQQKFHDSMKCGLEALSLLGLKINENPGQLSFLKELFITKWEFRKIKPEDISAMKEVEDERIAAIFKVLMLMLAPSFFYKIELYFIIVLKIVRNTLKHGITAAALAGLANWVAFLGLLGESKRAITFLDTLHDLLKKKSLSRHKILAKFSLYYFGEHMRIPLEQTLKPLKDVFREGLERGDSDFTAFTGNLQITNSFITGKDLDELSLELRRLLQYSIQVKNFTSKTFSEIYFQYIICLQGQAKIPFELKGNYFDPEVMLPVFKEGKTDPFLFNYHFFQSQLYLLFNQSKEAFDSGQTMWQYAKSQEGTPQGNFLLFIDSCILFQYGIAFPELAKGQIKKLQKHLKKIRKIAETSEEDYLHKAILLEGFIAGLKKEEGLALRKFNAGIDMINPALNSFVKALSNLLYGRYCTSTGFHDLSEHRAKESVLLFNTMGARAVVDHIKDEFQLQGQWEPSQTSEKEDKISSSSGFGGKSGIDIFSLIKGTQVISGEFDLSHLIKKMLSIMIENAGAERGILVLKEDEVYKIVAEANNKKDSEELLDLQIEQYPNISTAVMNFVIRTGEPVILDHAHLNGRFVIDTYIQEHKVRSLLCMNFKYKNKDVGILYLENNLISGAFTQDRIEILNILTTQAAISIENAKFYKHITDLNNSYERFVPETFLGQLGKESILGIDLGDQAKKNMAVMFADIRSFTAISEEIGSDEVFQLLNEIWGLINPIIDENGGIIDKYIGDAILALYPNKFHLSLRTAVEIQNTLKQFNKARKKEGEFEIEMGIGIHSGPMILGTVGSHNRLNTTVIGDTVNIASRLETMTKDMGVKILLTNDIVESLPNPDSFQIRKLGNLSIKGKSQNLAIYEEFSSYEDDLKEKIIANLPLFNTFIQSNAQGEQQDARHFLSLYLENVPEDKVARYLSKS